MDHEPSPAPESSTRNRDARLRTLTRLRRGLAVGCVALIGGLAAFVAQAKPGKATTATSQSSPGHTGSTAGSAQGSTSSPSISPPPQAPTPAPAPAPAPTVSGGS